MNKMVLAVMALALLVVGTVFAQSTMNNSIAVRVNPGDFGWGTFTFGHGVNGQPGTTELIVQCDFHRAELITNFDVYGEQQSSQFFTVGCHQSDPTNIHSFALNFPTDANGNPQPLYESLTMTGRDTNGQPISQTLNLEINSASWEVTGTIGPRCFVVGWCRAVGNAQVAY